MNFTFKFQTLLEQRQREEDERQRDLAKLMRQQMILQTQLGQMQDTIRESKQALTGSLVGRVDLERVAGFTRYSGQTQQRGMAIVVRLATLEKLVAAARRQLLEATQARKALELLRQRHEEQWRRTQQRREMRRMDELATQQYIRDTMLGVKR